MGERSAFGGERSVRRKRRAEYEEMKCKGVEDVTSTDSTRERSREDNIIMFLVP